MALNEFLGTVKEYAEIANATKSECFNNFSHQLRVPLNVIFGFSQSIRNDSFRDFGCKRYARSADNIHDPSQRFLDIISNILAFSAIDIGKLELNFEDVGLSTIVDASMECCRLSSNRST